MEEKRCPGCSETKPVEEFSKDGGGLQTYCKQCHKGRVLTAYYKKKDANPDGFEPVPSKRCSGCREIKPADEFYVQKFDLSGLSSKCKRCTKAYQAMRKYGISPDEFQALLDAQDGKCAICLKEPQGGKYLAVDHCHDSGKIRGLLCMPCNTALGKFPTLEILQRAMAYLNENEGLGTKGCMCDCEPCWHCRHADRMILPGPGDEDE